MCVARQVCVSGGKQWLVKTFTSWQVLASWQVLGAVSKAERYWGLCFSENIGRFAAGAWRYLWRYTFVRITVLQRPELCGYPGRRITHQYLTIYIENVIISVTMITKMLLVTRPSNLRCKAFYGVSL